MKPGKIPLTIAMAAVTGAAVIFFVARFVLQEPAPISRPAPSSGVLLVPAALTPVQPAAPVQTPVAKTLRVEKILACTNEQRRAQRLKDVALNRLLTQAAEEKVADMFDREYFAHTSPLGFSAGDLAKQAGYNFLAVGENLAQGNFVSECDLVQQWMQSPGHKENIMRPQYSEVGIAAARGQYEGRRTWLAVQIFAAPLSACPEPEPGLLAEIEANERVLRESRARLQQLQQATEQARDLEDGTYEPLIAEYGALAAEYNRLYDINRGYVAGYNTAVRERQQCIEQLTAAGNAPEAGR